MQNSNRDKTPLLYIGIAVAFMVLVGIMVFSGVKTGHKEPIENGKGPVKEPDTSLQVIRTDQKNAFIIKSDEMIEIARPTVTIHEDAKCPHCAEFNQQYFDKLLQRVRNNEIWVRIEMYNILDSTTGSGDYSTRIIGAMLCLAEHDKEAFIPFHKWVYANQPQGADSMPDDQIIAGMREAGAGDAAIKDFIDDAWRPPVLVGVMQSQENIYAVQESVSVPLVVFDGKKVDRNDPEWIEKLLDEPAVSPSASTSKR